MGAYPMRRVGAPDLQDRCLPSLAGLDLSLPSFPTVETVGYFRTSLRDRTGTRDLKS
jgi:hypothetical protein